VILVVVAHPDDESLFCGATIAKHVSQGELVHVVSMGTGVGSRGWPDQIEHERVRVSAFQRALAILGATGGILNTFPDQQSDTVPQLVINKAVEDVMHEPTPKLVYTHHVGDLNTDHRRVAEAVLVATRMGPMVRCMSPEFPERCVGRKFKPTYQPFYGTEAWNKKIAACLCYETEIRKYPHPRSEKALRSRAETFMEIR
jgi:LmbE family N-acetylglucosaminyl deacetylase